MTGELGAPDEDGFQVDHSMNDAIRGAARGTSLSAARERLLRELSGMSEDDRKARIREVLNGPGTLRDRFAARLALDGMRERDYGPNGFNNSNDTTD